MIARPRSLKKLEVNVRSLTDDDEFDDLVKLFQKSMAGFEGDYEDELLNELLYHLQGRYGTHYFVAVDTEDRVVGLIGYVLETQDVYQVGWFAVDEDHKGQGIGTMLVRHIEAELAGRARLLMAEVWTSGENPAAPAFYIKNGYVPTATIPDYYDDEDGDMTFFIKRLKPKEAKS